MDSMGDEGAARKKRKRSTPSQLHESNPNHTIEALEVGIKASQKNYNDIVTLLQMARQESYLELAPASIALCRVFSRLLVEGRLSLSRETPLKAAAVSEWLRKRYNEYKKIILPRLTSGNVHSETTWVMVVQLLREEVDNTVQPQNTVWKSGIFPDILNALCDEKFQKSDCSDFALNHAQRYDDVRYHTFAWVIRTLGEQQPMRKMDRILTILSTLEMPQRDEPRLNNCLCGGHSISMSIHMKQAQQAWLAFLQNDLQIEHRKLILSIMTSNIIPWFYNVEVLMDFLTDSYDIGGATSLLALSGLFHLIQEKNLDYADFYTKLYSLLDHNLLQSKHRSRFFRLLDTFLSSTHLPAAMVASFLKRLSRLSLHGPPGGIVALIPWIYNMLMSHPACTFMIHREPRTKEEREDIEEAGALDPFDMGETDPMKTRAIDSCLWEIETLRSHYHPNVGSLAGIIAEQFTKKSYNLEDFLDHSYNSLIEIELQRDMKKTPVVEFDIPKAIFRQGDGDSHLEDMIADVLKHSS